MTEQDEGFGAKEATTKSGSDQQQLVMCDCYPKHCTHGDTCWCEPQVEIINGNRIIIHNEAN